LVTPERQVIDDEVTYASVPAWDGLLGVAPQRAPLLVKLGDGPLRLDLASGLSQSFFVGGGFAQMKDNRLTLLTAEAVPADQIDVQAARDMLRQAEHQVPVTDEEAAGRDRQARRARAMIDLAESAGTRR
jgi:F-type H+-transporting ATPase subunit epsilon